MEDQLISFEIAKLAKEKGFDGRASFYYLLDFKGFKSTGIPEKHGLPIEGEHLYQNVKIGKFQPHLASAPTQSLLQKWLRELHSIDIVIKPKEDYYTLLIEYFNPGLLKISDNILYTTYEKALEVALEAGLKLIKK